MEPYRSAPQVRAAETPRDAGIVDDIIRQFADPMAFFRELVQNSIDAGTDRIDIKLRHDATRNIMRVTVLDAGEGMTRDILENRLLVLFRSTKERDDSKIGKFGVGFASVLALSPEVVKVTTARDGRRLALHLFRDFSYELFDAGSTTATGTSVDLEIPIDAGEAPEFAASSVASLVRWCRHATVPIVVDGTAAGAPGIEQVRIDRPLGLEDALIEIRESSTDGITAVVGIQADLRPYAGFFNHGLMLHESREPMFGRLAFKVQDARLGHTMSRDNVRRDRRFDEVMRFVQRVVARRLTKSIAAALVESLDGGDRDRYRALIRASGALDVALSDDQLVFPLVEPLGGATWVRASEIRGDAWIAQRPGPLTAALVADGTPVIDGTADTVVATLGSRRELAGSVELALTLVAPLERSGSDIAMVDELVRLLALAHREPAEVHLAELIGARALELAITGRRADSLCRDEWVLDNETCGRNPFAWLRRPPLILNAAHSVVARARQVAVTEPLTAASLLARVLLLARDELDRQRCESIAADVIDRILERG